MDTSRYSRSRFARADIERKSVHVWRIIEDSLPNEMDVWVGSTAEAEDIQLGVFDSIGGDVPGRYLDTGRIGVTYRVSAPTAEFITVGFPTEAFRSSTDVEAGILYRIGVSNATAALVIQDSVSQFSWSDSTSAGFDFPVPGGEVAVVVLRAGGHDLRVTSRDSALVSRFSVLGGLQQIAALGQSVDGTLGLLGGLESREVFQIRVTPRENVLFPAQRWHLYVQRSSGVWLPGVFPGAAVVDASLEEASRSMDGQLSEAAPAVRYRLTRPNAEAPPDQPHRLPTHLAQLTVGGNVADLLIVNSLGQVLAHGDWSSPDLCVKAEEAPRLRLGCLGDLLFLEE